MNRSLLLRSVLAVIAGSFAAPAMPQEAPGRVIRYEVSAAWMGLTPKGSVQTNSNRVDFHSDLGMHSMQSQAGFRLMAQTGDRTGVFIEFIPYRFTGDQTTTRSFRFGGVTYGANQHITANASLSFVSIGYQYNVVNQRRLELGLVGAATYVAVKARASSPAIGYAEVTRSIPFPIVGLAARYSPDSLRSWFSIRGETRGMTFGSYGGYIDAAGALGFTVSPHVTFEAGYRMVDGDGHHATRGAQFNLRGPTIGVRIHDK